MRTDNPWVVLTETKNVVVQPRPTLDPAKPVEWFIGSFEPAVTTASGVCDHCEKEAGAGRLVFVRQSMESGVYHGLWCSEDCLYAWHEEHLDPCDLEDDPHECSDECKRSCARDYVGCALPLVNGDLIMLMISKEMGND